MSTNPHRERDFLILPYFKIYSILLTYSENGLSETSAI